MKRVAVVFFHSIDPNHTHSYPVKFMFEMLYKHTDLLKIQGIDVYGINNFLLHYDKKRLSSTNSDINEIYMRTIGYAFKKIENNKKFHNGILIGFHPKGWDRLFSPDHQKIIKGRNIYTILWQDDLHAINRTHKKRFDEIVTDQRFDLVNKILTPSIKYYEDMMHPYLDKTEFYFYCLNEEYFDINTDNYFDREKKILLSGLKNYDYGLLAHINKSFDKNLLDVLEHPNRDKVNGKIGKAYYDHISKYRGAFIGFHNHPLDHVIAKIIEVLFCGTLAFIQPIDDLKRLGLVEFEHYVPINIEKGVEYYRDILNSDKGRNIAQKGCQHVRNNFNSKKRIEQFIGIINSIQ